MIKIKYKTKDFLNLIKENNNSEDLIYIKNGIFIKKDLYNKIIKKLIKKKFKEFYIIIDLKTKKIKINKC